MSHLLRLLRQRGRARIAILLTLLSIGAGTLLALASSKSKEEESPIDLEEYAELMSNRVVTVDDLVGWYYDQQDNTAPLIPPGLELLEQPGTPEVVVIDLNAKQLEQSFIKALLNTTPIYRNSVPTYELFLQETIQGTIEIRDSSDNLLYTSPQPLGYAIPYDALFRQSQNPLLYLPELARYHLKSKITLLPQEYVEPYLFAKQQIEEAQALLQEEELNPPMMMLMGEEDELRISGMTIVSNAISLEIQYPESYSGLVWSAYSYDMQYCPITNAAGSGGGFPDPPDTNDPPEECTNCISGNCDIDITNTFMGLERTWTLVSSNVVLTGATTTVWLDTRPLGFDANGHPAHRFYGLGANTDYDADGLSDSFEMYVSKTDTSLWDSDLDGVSDADEWNTGTNPLNPDDPPNVEGTIHYTGQQTNAIRVLAVADPDSWSLTYSTALNDTGAYHIVQLPPGAYYLKAYRDLNTNNLPDDEEAWGVYSNNPVVITGRVQYIDIQLTESDRDGDGISDYTERTIYRTSPTNAADLPLQLTRLSSLCYYGYGVANTNWHYQEGISGLTKSYTVGQGWVTNGMFLPDLGKRFSDRLPRTGRRPLLPAAQADRLSRPVRLYPQHQAAKRRHRLRLGSARNLRRRQELSVQHDVPGARVRSLDRHEHGANPQPARQQDLHV